MKKKGVTLVEVLIVILVIGLLFVLLISKVDFTSKEARVKGVETDFRSFQLAADYLAKKNVGYNSLVDGDDYSKLEESINKRLDASMQITIASDGSVSMKNGKKDPWGNEYVGQFYQGDAAAGAFAFLSKGPNGVKDTNLTTNEDGFLAPDDGFGDDYYTIVSWTQSTDDTRYSVHTFSCGFGEGETGVSDVLVGPPDTGEYVLLGTSQTNPTMDNWTLSIQSSGPLKNFREVKIKESAMGEASTLSDAYYTATSGSTVITFNAQFLMKYTGKRPYITIVSTGDDVETRLDLRNNIRAPGVWWKRHESSDFETFPQEIPTNTSEYTLVYDESTLDSGADTWKSVVILPQNIVTYNGCKDYCDYNDLYVNEGCTTLGSQAMCIRGEAYLPKSLTNIGSHVFSSDEPWMGALQAQAIYYAGTMAEWEAIEKAENWDQVCVGSDYYYGELNGVSGWIDVYYDTHACPDVHCSDGVIPAYTIELGSASVTPGD